MSDIGLAQMQHGMIFSRLDDSPMFRQQIQALEEDAETLRDKCLKFYKGCRKYTLVAKRIGGTRDLAYLNRVPTKNLNFKQGQAHITKSSHSNPGPVPVNKGEGPSQTADDLAIPLEETHERHVEGLKGLNQIKELTVKFLEAFNKWEASAAGIGDALGSSFGGQTYNLSMHKKGSRQGS
ncbi:ankyrin repeat and PH [Datura stramonium]|uniref:Ankyrin repeat and PH n=1 Tax=Datura stramonium TaxID=4076 RepID=A0ABS8SU53_DATST|nr:ankyrin repeat and PH [Datura stramonium]